MNTNNRFNAKMGVEVDAKAGVEGILAQAGLNWGVEKVPLFFDHEGNRRPVDQSALVRSDNGEVFGTVPNGWNIHNNHDVAETASQYASMTGAEIVRAGSFDNGQTTFFILSNPGRAFALRGNDAIDNYTLVWNVHKYGTTLRLADLMMRQICTNGMVVADGEGTTMKINHRGQLDPSFVARSFAKSTKGIEQFRESADFLASRRYTNDAVRRYLAEVFPSTAKKEEEAPVANVPVEVTLSRPAQIVFDTIDTQPGAEMARGTWWNVFNGVTHATNHLLSANDETRTSSVLFGVNRRRNMVALSKAIEYARAA